MAEFRAGAIQDELTHSATWKESAQNNGDMSRRYRVGLRCLCWPHLQPTEYQNNDNNDHEPLGKTKNLASTLIKINLKFSRECGNSTVSTRYLLIIKHEKAILY